ncbi:unnamed protein product, partial [Prunus brigantina]
EREGVYTVTETRTHVQIDDVHVFSSCWFARYYIMMRDLPVNKSTISRQIYSQRHAGLIR